MSKNISISFDSYKLSNYNALSLVQRFMAQPSGFDGRGAFSIDIAYPENGVVRIIKKEIGGDDYYTIVEAN